MLIQYWVPRNVTKELCNVMCSTWMCIRLHMGMDDVILLMSYFLMTSPIFLWMGGWVGRVHVTLTPTLISTLKLHVGISKSFGKFDTVSCVSKH